MKKSLIALATLAATASFAQSTVTIYGQADAAYSSVKSGANSFTGILGAGRGSNFFGAMGTEDLGGGWKANFKLEAQYNLDSGAGNATNLNNQPNGGPVDVSGSTAAALIQASPSNRLSVGGAQGLTFNRYSYAGLSNDNFGEIRVGRDYTSTFNAVLGADTTGANGVQNTLFQTLMIGASQSPGHATTANASNMIGYESPNTLGGLRVKAQVWYGENVNPAVNGTLMPVKGGDGNSVHVYYNNGPLSAGIASQKTKGTAVAANATVGYAGIPGDYKVDAAYAKYDLGVVLLTAGQVTEKLISAGANTGTFASPTITAGTAGEHKNVSNIVGFSYPVAGTAMKINGTYITSKYTIAGATNSKATQVGLQALYAMSKRTDLYVNYAVTDNSVGTAYGIVNGAGRLVTVAASGDKTTGYQVGIRHNF